MARYENGTISIAAAAGAAYASLHTGATKPARIIEIGVSSDTAVAAGSALGLGRPANTPVATTSVLGQAEDPIQGASTVNVDTVWSTAPTAPTIFLRRFRFGASIGAGAIWTWDPTNPLIIPVSAWLVLWNYGGAAGAALPLYVVWDE